MKLFKLLCITGLVVSVSLTFLKAQTYPGNALVLDGSNDYFDIPNTASFDFSATDAFTIEYWIYPTHNQNNKGVIISRWAPLGANGEFIFQMGDTGVGQTGIEHYVILSSQARLINVSYTWNAWQHVALTYSSVDGRKLFINGILVSSQPTPAVELNSTMPDLPIRVGRGHTNGDNHQNHYWGGTMDELRIWNVARTEQEINDNMTKDLSSNPPAGLVAYYQFENDNANDEISSANNGTLSGSPVFTTSFTIPEITSFTLLDQVAAPTIDAANHTISVDVYSGTDISSLAAIFSMTAGASAKVGGVTQTSGSTINDYTNPVTYKLTGSNGITSSWTVTVTVCTSCFKSFPGNALNFDGNDDKVEIPHDPKLSLTTFTIELWVYPTRVHTGWQRLIAKESTTGEFRNYGLFIVPNTMLIHFSFRNSSNTVWESYDSNQSLNLNQWNHVSFTFDGASMKLYLDGILDNEVTVTSSPYLSSFPVILGDLPAIYDGSQGSLDEIRIWNVARTQAEIQNNRFTELIGGEPGLVAYYNFDSGVANDDNTGLTTLYDQTSNNLSGTLSGFALNGSTSNWVKSFSIDANFTSFSVPNQVGDVVIDADNKTIAVNINTAATLSDLIATFTLADGATAKVGAIDQTSGVTSNDFTSPVVYTIAADGNVYSADWTVTATQVINTETDITSFWMEATPAAIDPVNHTIDSYVSNSWDITSAPAYFELSFGATATVNGNPQISNLTENDYSLPVTFTVTSEDGNQMQDWVVTIAKDFGLNPSSTGIFSFSFEEQNGPATIDDANSTISIEVFGGTDLSNLVASFVPYQGAYLSVNGLEQISGVTANDFSSPLTYLASDSDGNTREWTVTVTTGASSSNTDILDFDLPYQACDVVIDAPNHAVNVQIIPGTNLTNLIASFKLPPGASAMVGGTPQVNAITNNDFSSPVSYTITAQDGTTIQNWLVTVSELPPGPTAVIGYGQVTWNYTFGFVESQHATVGRPIDLDGDGDLDIVTNLNMWHENQWGDGTYSFSGSAITLPEGDFKGDIDSDGAIDIVGSTGGKISWYKNNKNATFGSAFDITTSPGNALSFDGVDDYVNVNTGNSSVAGNYTIEVWAKPLHATNTLTMISARFPNDASFDMKFLGGTTIHGDIGNGSAWINTAADANFSYTVGQWYHIAYVVTTTGYTIYINGTNVASGTFAADTPLLFDSNHNLIIGTYASGVEQFQGDIDEVRIWNVARSQGEIQNNQFTEFTGNEPGLVAYYTFNQGTAGGSNTGETTLFDNTQNGNTGTLTNFALTGSTSNWVSSVAPISPSGSNLIVADFDNDNDMDLLSSSSQIRWYENANGSGTAWTPHTILTSSSVNGYAVDVDGDGIMDVVDVSGSTVSWSKNNGGGSSWTRNTISGISGSSLLFADLDNDGLKDFIAGTSWYHNNGDGSVATGISYGTRAATHTLDFDGDGNIDLLAVGSAYTLDPDYPYFIGGTDPISWYRNSDGAGTFEPISDIVTFGCVYSDPDFGCYANSYFNSVYIGDVDGNGSEEIIYGSAGAEEGATQLGVQFNSSVSYRKAGPPPPKPVINDVIPTSAIAGDKILIKGNFGNSAYAATIGGKVAKIGYSGAVEWVVTVPDLPPGQADIIVTTCIGESNTWTGFSVIQNNETDFLYFSAVNSKGKAIIDKTNHTIQIALSNMTDGSSVAPMFQLSEGASTTVNATAQVSGVTTNDFTSPVTYTVTAQDMTTTQDWVVTAILGQTINSSLPDTVVYSINPIALSATASSGLPVTFSTSGTATITGDMMTILESGWIHITISQAGNNVFLPESIEDSIYVAKANQSLSFDPISDKQSSDAPFTVTGSSDVGLPVSFAPVGTVIINIGGQSETIGPNISIAGDEVTINSPGRASIVAQQPGEVNYNPASSVLQSFCVFPPKPTIAQSGSMLTSSSTEGNQWYLDGILLPDATANTFDAIEQGTYTVKVTITGCSSPLSDGLNFTITGIDIRKTDQIFLFPNPAQGWLNGKVGDEFSDKEMLITIMDSNGKYVEFDKKITLFNGQFQLDVSKYNQGIYNLILTNSEKNKSITSRFILE